MTPTSASQRIASSFAFFNNPFLRFENVTCLLVELSILLITIFPLPIPLSLTLAFPFFFFFSFFFFSIKTKTKTQICKQKIQISSQALSYRERERERERESYSFLSILSCGSRSDDRLKNEQKKHQNKQRNFPRKCGNLKYKERKKQKIFREKNENKKKR